MRRFSFLSGNVRQREGPRVIHWLLAPSLFLLAAAGGPAQTSPAAPAAFHVDPARSAVRFDADATGHIVHGITHQVTGEVLFDPEDLLRKADVTFRVHAAALETGNKTRDRRMRKSHLETVKYPDILFRSSRIKALAPTLRPGESQELDVEGTLSLHGVKKHISFAVKAARSAKDLRVTGGVPIRMTDFAIPIPSFLFLKLKNEVKVTFEVVAVPDRAR